MTPSINDDPQAQQATTLCNSKMSCASLEVERWKLYPIKWSRRTASPSTLVKAKNKGWNWRFRLLYKFRIKDEGKEKSRIKLLHTNGKAGAHLENQPMEVKDMTTHKAQNLENPQANQRTTSGSQITQLSMQTFLNPGIKCSEKNQRALRLEIKYVGISSEERDTHTLRGEEARWSETLTSFILWYVILSCPEERGLSRPIEGNKKRQRGKRYNGQKGCV